MNVLIIGGSSDIGLSLAEYLDNLGYNVISTYNKHKFELENIDVMKCDIRDKDSIEKLFTYVLDRYASIDLLINLASISMDNDFLSKAKNEFMRVLEVNLVGTFLCNQVYCKYISNGMIINISSTDGLDTYNNYDIDYAASKAGGISISKSISKCTNNKVLCVCPNWIDSGTTRGMDSSFLKSELSRIKQDRLISIDEFNSSIYKIINGNYKSGSVIRVDVRDGLLWIEKV